MRISDWSSDVCSSDLYHATTVAFADDARIAEHQQTAIVGITNQPAGALAQHDDRLGQLQLDEWRAAATTHGVELGFERSEEHTSELQSLMRISYAVFCLKQKHQPKSTYNLQNNNGMKT